MEVAQKFAELIREARIDARMTQEQVAKSAALTTNYYARVERGEVNPTITTAENIAKAIGVQICLPIELKRKSRSDLRM